MKIEILEKAGRTKGSVPAKGNLGRREKRESQKRPVRVERIKKLGPAAENSKKEKKTRFLAPTAILLSSWINYWLVLALAAACFKRCFFFSNCLFFS